MTLNNTAICLRSDTSANWSTNNPQLSVNEIGIDLTNYEIKIGTGVAWSNTQNFIANNTTVRNIQSTANSASSRASQALSAAATAQSLANSLNEWKNIVERLCFFSSPEIFNENLNVAGKAYPKGPELIKIARMFYNNTIDGTQARVTDTVTYDVLFTVIGIIYKAAGFSLEHLSSSLDEIIAGYTAWAKTAPVNDDYNKINKARG